MPSVDGAALAGPGNLSWRGRPRKSSAARNSDSVGSLPVNQRAASSSVILPAQAAARARPAACCPPELLAIDERVLSPERADCLRVNFCVEARTRTAKDREEKFPCAAAVVDALGIEWVRGSRKRESW